MNNWVVSLLVFCAIQAVCSVPYVKDEFEPEEVVHGIEYDSNAEDNQYETFNAPETVGLRKCSEFWCCLKSQKCMPRKRCKSLIGLYHGRQVKCPTAVQLA